MARSEGPRTRNIWTVYHEMSADELRDGLGLDEGYRVDGLIAWGGSMLYPYDLLEQELNQRGTHSQRLGDRGLLSHVAAFSINDRTFWFALVYGSAMLSEIAHLACACGSRRNLMLGSCGGLAHGQRTHDVIIPTHSFATESSAHAYAPTSDNRFCSDPALSDATERAIAKRHTVHQGPTMTHQAMLAETWDQIVRWSDDGYLGVEMEAATLFAVSRHFGVPAAGLLRVADNLIEQETVFSPSNSHGGSTKAQLLSDMIRVAVDLVTAP